jgi:hypothetical protein
MKKLLPLLFLIPSWNCFSQKPCSSDGFRDFDFWVGEWVVYTQDTVVAGYSEVEIVLDSCVIQENWSSASSAYTGKSFNSYNEEDGIWTQTWVDNSGVTIHFFGSFNNGVMHMTGRRNTKDGEIRYVMDYIQLPNGRLRQLWKASDDDGLSWTVLFDGVYRKRAQQ